MRTSKAAVVTVAGLALSGIAAASAAGTVSLSELVHSAASRELQLVPAPSPRAHTHRFQGVSRGGQVVFELRGVRACDASSGSARIDGRTDRLSAARLDRAIRNGVLRMAAHPQRASLSITCKPAPLTTASSVTTKRSRTGPPVNTSVPTLSGTALQGDTLTSTHGSWTHSPTSYSYQWQDCNSSGSGCSDVSGATSKTYILKASDVGATVRAVVTAGNSYGSGTATSAVLGPIKAPVTPPPPASPPANTAAPSVSGTDTQSNMLTTTNGSWSGSPSGYGYQWQDCDSAGASCANISGATSNTYMLQASDVGNTVRAVVAASNSSGVGVANSAATATVQPAGSPPANTGVPTVSGTAKQGSTLSTTNGSWSGSPTSYAYQWQDCNSSGGSCANISGATSQGYTLQASDVGNTVRAVVTATNSLGNASANSAVTSVVQSSGTPPSNTGVPTVSGTSTQGSTLTTTNGTWSGNPTSYAYQWQDCNTSGGSCANISGATSQGYTLQASDVGNTVRAVVTATNSLGNASANSAVTSAVQPSGSGTSPPANSSAPTVSGTATQGSALTAGNGAWTGNPTGYSYQWQDCNGAGAACVPIAGATSSSYTLTAKDVMNKVAVQVTASNAQGSSSPATSATTNVVSGSYTCTKYASPSGSNSNPGTASSPYADIAYLESSLSAGQTGCLESGTYGNTGSATEYDLTASGTATAPITIAPAPGANPRVIGWLILWGNYMTLEYLNIDGSNTAYAANAGINALNHPVSGAMEINGSGDVFQYNDFYQSVAAQRGVGILVGDYYNGYFPSGVTIRYNDLHDVGNPGDPSNGNAYDHIVYTDAGSGTQIYGNWMWGDPSGYCVQLFPDTNNDVVKNNVCDSSGSGIIIENDGGSTTTDNNAMSNNVFTNMTGLTANGTAGQGVLGGGGSSDTFTNNDCFNCPSGVYGEGPGGNPVASVTLSGNVTSNPLYVNAGAHDYQLQSGSPASSDGLWNGLGAAPPQAGF